MCIRDSLQVALVGARRQGLAEHLLAVGVERRGLVAADEDGVIGREHHVQQLRHVVARSREVVLDHVRQIVGLEADVYKRQVHYNEAMEHIADRPGRAA